MREILLPIKSEYIDAIKRGDKIVEYRGWKPSCNLPFKVYVYNTQPIGLVVGEFTVNQIIEDNINSLWVKTKLIGGIDYGTFKSYFMHKSKGYAFCIDNFQLYEQPKCLDEFNIKKAPQRFLYII